MKILIVEDDENKRNQLVRFLDGRYKRLEITEARSYQSGLRALLAGKYTVVLLDMSMPTFDKSPMESGGRFRPFGGRELLEKMRRESVTSAVVVVTQFETFGEGGGAMSLRELEASLAGAHSALFLGAVYYNASRSEWMGKLAGFLDEILLIG